MPTRVLQPFVNFGQLLLVRIDRRRLQIRTKFLVKLGDSSNVGGKYVELVSMAAKCCARCVNSMDCCRRSRSLDALVLLYGLIPIAVRTRFRRSKESWIVFSYSDIECSMTRRGNREGIQTCLKQRWKSARTRLVFSRLPLLMTTEVFWQETS